MAGLTLGLTVLHVAFVSLHLAMIAALAFSSDAKAAHSRLGYVLCSTLRLPDAFTVRGETTPAAADATATFCPDCTSATSPALILPELPAVPYRFAFSLAAPPSGGYAPAVLRHEARAKQSRAPPRTA